MSLILCFIRLCSYLRSLRKFYFYIFFTLIKMTRRGWTSKVVSFIRLGRWSRETTCPKIRYQKLVRCCEVTVYSLQIQGKDRETMPRKVALGNIWGTTTTWTQRYRNVHGRLTNKKFCSVSTRYTGISGRLSPSIFREGTFEVTQEPTTL